MPIPVRDVTILVIVVLFIGAIPAAAQDLNGFVRGDINSDLTIDLSDPVLLLEHLFGGSPALDCQEAADINDDGALLLDDVI